MFGEDSRIYKLFVSHANNEDEYYKFLEKLDASYEFEWEDYGNPSENLDEELYNQIKPVDVVIILSGLFYGHKKEIKKQIKIALELKKLIVVIRPYGMEDIPPFIEKVANDIVGWNTPCIVDTIKEISS
jgi:Thoeris protein ThsB, TIR-like domain